MPTSRRVAVGAALVIASMATAPAGASSFRRTTFEELAASSIAVVEVRVLDVSSAWMPEPTAYIATTAHLEVVRSLSGGFDVGDELFVREAGGSVDDYTMQAIGFPTFADGQHLVLFLTTWEDETGDWRVAGYGQGIYEVQRGADKIDRLVPTALQGEAPGQDLIATETVVPPLTPVSALASALRGQ